MSESEHSAEVYLKRIDANMKLIREMMTTVVTYMRDAESEVPEKMRRFIMYMHDVHDISYLYESRGIPVPDHVMRELERCDDRYRQLLTELHMDGGTFEKVRRDMAKDPQNRWDHTRQLAKPKES
jgi:septation ring formation regulator EzrA